LIFFKLIHVFLRTMSEQSSRIENGPQSDQRHITLKLIRKRSEHNECLVSTLEEIALHQEELEAIGPLLGRICGKTLRILLLQNNVISRMDPYDFRPFRSLEYLNLALNNIHLVEGISHLEFLNKLDLTLNFIHYDGLAESISCMIPLRSLKELFMIGNPCAFDDDTSCNPDNNQAIQQVSQKKYGWNGFRMYVIAKLPQLESLDGKQILRSERIQALQQLSELEIGLCELAEKKRGELEHDENRKSDTFDEDCTFHCPEDRTRISDELSRQKADKEQNESTNQPKQKGEKDFEKEQEASIQKAREREEKGQILQCNEGKWKYAFNEGNKPGCIQLDISIQKYLSSSLIDVDVHPSYISVVIKSKVLRLLLPTEVKSEQSVAQRSATTGNLLITMPKFNPKENVLATQKSVDEPIPKHSRERQGGRIGLNQEMFKTASVPKGSIRINDIVKEKCNKNQYDQNKVHMTELSSIRRNYKEKVGTCTESNNLTSEEREKYLYTSSENSNYNDEPPPPF